MIRSIWITWENQRRNHTLSSALGAKLVQFDLKSNRFVKYPVALVKTLITFIKEQPNLIFVQNPSLILAFFSVNYGKLFNIPVIVDAHNAGVYPFNGTMWWANKLTFFLFRHASFTIVTNSALADYVEQNGGKPIILPDPIPEFKYAQGKMNLKGKFNVLFICSWASDEPYLEVIKAASLLDKTIYIYITGNSKGKEKQYVGGMPENIILTGFLDEEDFISMLYSCDVVMDLTSRENCLVCGAYEAVAAEKLLVVSATEALKKYFYKGTLYTDNTSYNLANQINNAIKNKDILKRESLDLKKELLLQWQERKLAAEKLIQQLIA